LLARIEELVDTLCLLKYPTVFSMHPRLRVKLEKEPAYRELWKRLKQATHLKITPPVSYLDMLHLERNAMLVMTDSGGVQKESYFVATPCLTLRDETEWTETLADGWNRVVGTSPARILPLVESLCSRNGASPQRGPNLAAFGETRAGETVLAVLTMLKDFSNAYA